MTPVKMPSTSPGSTPRDRGPGGRTRHKRLGVGLLQLAEGRVCPTRNQCRTSHAILLLRFHYQYSAGQKFAKLELLAKPERCGDRYPLSG